MAANSKQGKYLTAFLAGFVALPAGLILLADHSALSGVILTLAGIGLLAQSFIGFRRIKGLEFTKE